MTRSEIIHVLLVRTAPVERPQLRRTLEMKPTEELEQMHREIVLEETEVEISRVQAERAADRIFHDLHMDKARQPQREAEHKKQLAEDRKTFDQTCRQYHIGGTDANFGLIRSTLGPGFTTFQIGQALRSGAVHVSPATPEEIQQWTREAEEQRVQYLRNADVVTLKNLVRQETQQKRERVAQAQLDATQTSAKQRHDLHGYMPLTPESRHRGNVVDAQYIKRLDAQGLRELIRIYGDFQLTNVLRYGNAQGA